MAHQLFIEKGFQATSIQDILDFSGISKGTFYNYFASKSELIIAIFKSIFKKLDQERNELMIGKNPSDIDIFIKQIELQLKTNKQNKLFALFEEVMVSNDADIRQFFKRGQLVNIRWTYNRFIDIFGESKQPYLLDCAIMFMGILQFNISFHYMENESNPSISHVVRYSIDRLVKMVDEIAISGDQLIQPEVLDEWLPNCKKMNQTFHQNLYHSVLEMKKALIPYKEQSRYIELLDFILDELLHSKNPRKFIIESAIYSLKDADNFFQKKELQNLEQLVSNFFQQLEQAEDPQD
jgi:AcrR family transcriptional regulator